MSNQKTFLMLCLTTLVVFLNACDTKPRFYAEEDKVYFSNLFGPKLITDADAQSIKTLQYSFGSDTNRVYYQSMVLTGLNPLVTTVLNQSYIKDTSLVYYCGLFTEQGELNGYWAAKPLDSLNATSFQLLARNYGSDGATVFFKNQRTSIDPNTIKIRDPESYATDHQFVYWNGRKVEESHGPTFEPLKLDTVVSNNYFRDKNNVYWVNQIIKDADSKTFEIFPHSFARDKNFVFYKQSRLTGLTSENVKVKGNYIWDKNAVYFQQTPIKEVDPATFEVTANSQAKDANHIYRGSRIK